MCMHLLELTKSKQDELVIKYVRTSAETETSSCLC